MSPLATAHPDTQLCDRWWHNYISTARHLPKEHTHEWLKLMSQAVLHHWLYRNSVYPAEQRLHRNRCRHWLVKSRWELMLLSIYGHIPPQQMSSLEEIQKSFEKALEE